MELISQIPVFGGLISTLIAFVAVLAVVVSVHEYGHYIVARWCGIHAETFSLGFGPVIFSRTDKRGTKWQLAAIPLGGYVKFLGDRNAASEADPEMMAAMTQSERDVSFPAAKMYKRALTIAAGPFFNFILAAVIFTGLAMVQGTATKIPTVGEMLTLPDGFPGLHVGDEILEVEGNPVANFSDIYQATSSMDPPGEMEVLVSRGGDEILVMTPYLLPPAVFGVSPLSAASEAGLEAGDIILQASGQDLAAFRDLKHVIETAGESVIALKIWRAGEVFDIAIAPRKQQYPDGNGGFEERIMIGVSGAFAFQPATEVPTPWRAVSLGVKQVGFVLTSSLNSIKHIFLGNLSPKNLQGPIGIAQISQEAASQGLSNFISLIAVISVGIGMLNLFPIPMLDGGHLMFYGIELLRRKPLGDKTMHISISIGLVMVLMLMVFVTYNDIARWWASHILSS